VRRRRTRSTSCLGRNVVMPSQAQMKPDEASAWATRIIPTERRTDRAKTSKGQLARADARETRHHCPRGRTKLSSARRQRAGPGYLLLAPVRLASARPGRPIRSTFRGPWLPDDRTIATGATSLRTDNTSGDSRLDFICRTAQPTRDRTAGATVIKSLRGSAGNVINESFVPKVRWASKRWCRGDAPAAIGTLDWHVDLRSELSAV